MVIVVTGAAVALALMLLSVLRVLAAQIPELEP
jgi:hypothetical protein